MEKNKSSLRMKYDAEVSVIKSKIGDLDEVRKSLGLSQRKISQLLMVDPSAWTRWTNGTTPPPASVYRALQWYLALIEKHPEWHPHNSFLRGFSDTNATDLQTSIQRQNKQLDSRVDELETRLFSQLHRNTNKSAEYRPNKGVFALIFLQFLLLGALIFKELNLF